MHVVFGCRTISVISEVSQVFASAMALAKLLPMAPISARSASVVMKIAGKGIKVAAGADKDVEAVCGHADDPALGQ